MTEGGSEEAIYARLPEDLLADLLSQTPTMTRQVTDLLLPAVAQRDELRRAAEDQGLIQIAPKGKPGTVCAIDGGFAVERTIAIDIAMAVAVGVEGFAPADATCAWNDNQYESFQQVLVHDMDNHRLARAACYAHEVAIISDAPHDVRVFDGSHITPVIQLNSGFSSATDHVVTRSVKVANQVDLPSALAAFVNDPKIIAMPKYDSSRDLTAELGKHLADGPIPGDDKYVTSLILGAGEYTTPRQVPKDPWRQLHLGARPGLAAEETDLVNTLNEIIDPLRNRELKYTYWRPSETAPTYRIEMKPALAASRDALGVVLSTLERQITGPFVREPYPQYLADVMAKSVGLGLSALQAAAHLALTRTHPELAPLLVHSYRTEGI